MPDDPSLYVADAVQVGEPLQFVMRGTPGDTWFLIYGTVPIAVNTPFGVFRLLDAVLLTSGTIPASGFADLHVPIAANPAFQGQTVLFQALVGTTLTNLGSLTFR